MDFISPSLLDTAPLAYLLLPALFLLLVYRRDYHGRLGMAIRVTSSALAVLMATAVLQL